MDEHELATIVWRAPEWINALGGLRTDNVLEYFAQSPFFDRRSNNAVLKMQSQFQSFGDVSLALTKMTGMEFVVSSAFAPDLFIISKQQRDSIDEVRLLNVYMIANGNIYLAPDAHHVVSSRMLNVAQALKTTMDLLQESMGDVSATTGNNIKSKKESKNLNDSTPSPKQQNNPSTDLTLAEVQSMHKVLYNTVTRLS